MSQLQWILLVLGLAVIGGIYWYTRRSERPGYFDDVPHLDEIDGDPDAPEESHWHDDPDLLDWPDEHASQETTEAESPAEAEPARAAEPDPELERGPVPRRLAELANAEPRSWFRRIGDSLRRHPRAEEEDEAPAQGTRGGVRMPRAPEGDEKLVVLHVLAGEGQYLYGDDIHRALEACGLRFGPRYIYHRIMEVDGVPESVFSVANSLKPGYLDPAERDELVTRGLSLFMVIPGPEQAVIAFRDMLSTARSLAESLDATILDENRQPLTRQMAQYIQEEVAEVERRHHVAHLQGH